MSHKYTYTPLVKFNTPLGSGVLAITTLFALGGCASVNSYKVDAKGKRDQEAAEGIPYYQPRPYVAVKAPFPVNGYDLLVTGRTNDKGDILISKKALPAAVHKWMHTADDKNSFVLSADTPVQIRKHAKNGQNSQGGNSEGDGKPNGDTSADKAPDTGKASIQVSGGAASPVVPIGELFDIVYLPDFNERYVLSLNPGLGNLTATVTLQGGMLNSLNTNIDNTEIAKMVSQTIASVIDIKKQLLLADAAPAADTDPLGDAVAKQAKKTGTRTVTLRIRLIEEALPGIYPVLKPMEQIDSIANWNSPMRPGSINFRVRQRIDVELLSASTRKTSNADGPTQPTKIEGSTFSALKSAIASVLPSDIKAKAGDLSYAEETDQALILRFSKRMDEATKKRVVEILKEKAPVTAPLNLYKEKDFSIQNP